MRSQIQIMHEKEFELAQVRRAIRRTEESLRLGNSEFQDSLAETWQELKEEEAEIESFLDSLLDYLYE